MNGAGQNLRIPVVRVPPKRVAERYRPPRGSGNTYSEGGRRGALPFPSGHPTIRTHWPPRRPSGAGFRWTKPTRHLCYSAYTAGCAQYRCPLHGSPLRGSHPVGNAPRTGRWRRYRRATNPSRRCSGRGPLRPRPQNPPHRVAPQEGTQLTLRDLQPILAESLGEL